MISMDSFKNADWAKGDGLLPAIVQDAQSMRILMLGYVNQESLQKTVETGLVIFFSRSRQELWQKGATSGNGLRLRSITLDCDHDTFLILADPQGPTCHNGTQSCFGDDKEASLSVLADLAHTIHQRRIKPDPNSYTAKLFAEGLTRIAQKVGEEGVETALAGATRAPDLASEAADLVYHLLVLLEAADTPLSAVLAILQERSGATKAKI